MTKESAAFLPICNSYYTYHWQYYNSSRSFTGVQAILD